MKEITEKNLAFLKEHFPLVGHDVAWLRHTPGCEWMAGTPPNVLCNGIHCHAPKDPLKEAQRLVGNLNVKEGGLLVFMGIGLGYQIEAFKNMYRDNVSGLTVICVERNTSLFWQLVSHRDISFLEGSHLFVGEDLVRIVEFIQTVDPLVFSGYRIVKLRGACTVFEQYYREVEGHLKNFLSSRLSDLLTMHAFDTLWLKNAIDNIPTFVGRSSIPPLEGVAEGATALVVGAGPSLRTQLATIRKKQDQLLIIACDTALEPLCKAGIVPDFTVAVDAQYQNFLDFFSYAMSGDARDDSVLVCDLTAYPKIPGHWHGPLFFFCTVHEDKSGRSDAHPIATKFSSFYRPTGRLRCGGSVASTAIDLALFLCTGPVLLCGLDFAYTGFKTHVNSSPAYTLYYAGQDRLTTISTSFLRRIAARKTLYRNGIAKKRVLSDYMFGKYLSWFEPAGRARDGFQRVFNASAEGSEIPGIRHIDLDRYLKRSEADTPPKSHATLGVRSVSQKPLTRTAARRFLYSVRNEIAETKRLCSRLSPDALKDTLSRSTTFLSQSIALSLRLYKEEPQIKAGLMSILTLLEGRVLHSIELIKE
ncbi:MAG: DUF115 domain-containing protein [Spirochaetes bacterium]|nr:DUF115 domain-containing protein [Spirochaetota bacterium]